MKRKKIPDIYGVAKRIYKTMRKCFFCMLTYISPKLNNKIRYLEIFHKWIPLDNPKTMTEKVIWLKLNNYNYNPLVSKCADKYAVRSYVKECGLENILNKVYYVYDSVDEIKWNDLPYQFVLKWNFGAGMNIICKNKSDLNGDEVIKQMRDWGRCKYWLTHAEMQYKHMKKKIVCEKYLEDVYYDVLPDYKVYCINGIPLAILVMLGRGSQITAQFYDTDWNKLNFVSKYKPIDDEICRPSCLDEMLDASKKLSENFPFVRCDYYIVNDKLYFGEMTFTPAGGFLFAQPEINGTNVADCLRLEKYEGEKN